ncbi:MAG TPA: hypothetical protein VHZ95_04420, partial [Polyangiales bacterium]|nr:hypothetical protein [Polyangiales bacterium]
MPLVVYALGAYVVGLYAGFAGSPVFAFAGIVAAIAVGFRRGKFAALGLGVLALAGIGIARSAASDDTHCAKRAEAADSLAIVIADSIAPGGFSRGRVAECATPIAVSANAGSASAGSTILARGSVLRSQRGLLMQDASISLLAAPPLLPRMRAAAGRAIDRTFRDDAPLVRALLIADRGDLSPEVRDRFAAAG